MRRTARRRLSQRADPEASLGVRTQLWLAVIRKAFNEFLALPSAVIAGFLLLALLSYYLDRVEVAWLGGGTDFLRRYFFTNPQSTADLLTTITGSVISVTSITITLLLLVVQQSATNLGAQVFDQFLRRWENQFYFGYFVGLSLYSLLVLATVNEPFNPVFGALIALLGTLVGLFLLLSLFYTTVNQMRPVVIIEVIHELILVAHEHQQDLIQRTRRSARFQTGISQQVHLPYTGFVTRINLDLLARAVGETRGEVEVEFSVNIGSFISYLQQVAEVRAYRDEDLEQLATAVRRSISVERQRDLNIDAAFGIKQLEVIAWTSISSAKQNPAPGTSVILYLTDLLPRFAEEQDEEDEEERLPVVYNDDTIFHIFTTLEALAVASVESMQLGNFAAVVGALTEVLRRMPATYQSQAEEAVRRILPGLSGQILTTELEQALEELATALVESARPETARRVEATLEEMREPIGSLRAGEELAERR